MLFAPRPKTPLRVFCIAAFEFLARLRGGTLGRQRRLALAHACDFGSLCDRFYDHRTLDRSEYRSLRNELRRLAPEPATSLYLHQLREAERSRPNLAAYHPEIANAVFDYRTRVLDLSLRWMQEISGLSGEPVKFCVLLNLVDLMQLADDVLDWEDDQAVQCPSYVTALLLDRPTKDIGISLRAQACALLQQMIRGAKQDADTVPFAIAGVLTWTLTVALIKLGFRK